MSALRRIVLCWVVLATALCLGCKRERAPDAPTVDAATLALIDAAGDRALLTIVVRPEGLPKLLGSLGPLLDTLPAGVRPSVKDPHAALEAALGPLPGRDTERPLVAALFAPPRVAPPGALTPILSDLSNSERPPPAMRHRLLIPAKDPDGLAAALRARLVERGAQPKGEALTLAELGVVRVYAEADRARVEVAAGGAAPIDWGVRGGPSARTPALAAAAAPRVPAAVLVRPWLLRSVFIHHGAQQVAAALAYAPPEVSGQLASAGAAELLGGEVLMHTEAAEFDDWSLVAGATASGVRLTMTATLAPGGVALLGARGAYPPLTPTRSAIASVMLAGDVRGMLDAAAVPSQLRDASGRDFGRAFARCGLGCPLHAALRQPVGTLAVVLRDTPLAELALRSPQLALLTGAGGRPEASAAVQFAPGVDLDAVRALVERLAFAETEVTTRSLPDGSTAMIAARGFDPGAAYGAPLEAEAALGRFAVEPSAVAKILPPDVRALAATIALIEGRLDHAGDALVGQIAVQMVTPSKPLAPPAPLERESPGPIVSTPATAASACMVRAAAGAREALSALGAVDPARRVAVTATALGELRVDLSCAAADPSLAPAVVGLRRLLIAPIVQRDLDGWTPEPALTLLQSLCDAGDEALCDRVRAVRARPIVDLPALASNRCAQDVGEGRRLRVRAAVVDLDGTPLPAEPTERRAAIAAALGPGQGTGPIKLGIDQSLSWVQVAPLFADLAAAGVETVHVVARHAGHAVFVPLTLRDAERAPAEPAGDEAAAAPLAEPVSEITLRIGGNAAALPDGRSLLPADIDPATLDTPLALAPSDAIAWARVVEYIGAACPQVTLGTEASTAAPARLEDDRPEMRPATRDREVIRQVIRRHQAAVRYCYQKGLVKDPELAGKVTVRFQIGTSGTVGDVAADVEGLEAPAVVDCVRKVAGEMRFPPAQTTSAVSYPFIFAAE